MNESSRVGPSLVERARELGVSNAETLAELDRAAFVSRVAGGTRCWYVLADGARVLREATEQATAFVGPSHSERVDAPATWDESDPFEALLSSAGVKGFRLRPRRDSEADVAEGFARLRELRGRRPGRSAVEPAPLSRRLRDFELLLRHGDWPAADRLLREFRDRGQLTSDQLACLHWRVLAGRGHWSAILAHPDLPRVVQGPLPFPTAEAVAAAIHHEWLQGVAAEDATRAYRERVAPLYGPVFRRRSNWREPAALAAAAIADACATEAAPAPTGVVGPNSGAGPPSDASGAAIAEGAEPAEVDPRREFADLIDSRLTPASAARLVAAACDLEDAVAARSVVAAVERAGLVGVVASKKSTKAMWKALLDSAADGPTDWFSWLERVAAGRPAPAAKGWGRPLPGRFAGELLTALAHASGFVLDALPTLLEVVLEERRPEPEYRTVYRELLQHLALDDGLSADQADTLLELAAASLHTAATGPGSNETQDVVECLQAAWARLRRRTLIDWGLDALELVAAHAAHRRASVAGLVEAVGRELQAARRHLTGGQREFFILVATDLDAEWAFESLAAEPASDLGPDAPSLDTLRSRLGRRTVVLLTMTDRIVTRFLQLMAGRYPDARVDACHDAVATSRLRDLAKNADVFIVNTWDMSHAATTFVPSVRSADAATLYPAGKSAARQLDALEEYLRGAG